MSYPKDMYSKEGLELLRKNSMQYVPKKQPIQQEPPTISGRRPFSREEEIETKTLNAEELEQLELEEDEEDEEFRRWEMEQIRKGGGAGTLKKLEEEKRKKDRDARTKAAAIPLLTGRTAQPIQRTSIEGFQKKLKMSLNQLEESHSSHETQLKQTQNEIVATRNAIQRMEKEHQEASAIYMFYQEIREYLSDLCNCPAEKAPLVEDCEDELLNLEISQVAKLQAKQNNEVWSEVDSAEDIDYLDAKDSIMHRADNIFADTYEEFTSVRAIKAKFEQWKFQYSDSYIQSYCSLSIPLVFAPFVRLELLKWNPLSDQSPVSFDQMNWFNQLFDYGVSKNEDAPFSENDDDLNLIPHLVEKVVLPKVVKLLTHVWNPRSTKETGRVVRLIELLSDFMDLQSDNMKEVFAAVNVSLLSAIENLPIQRDEIYLQNLTKLFEHVAMLHKYFPSVESYTRMLHDALLNSRLTPSLQQKISQPDQLLVYIERITAALPSSEQAGGVVPTRLQLFHNFVLNFVKKLESTKADSQLILRGAKVLSALNDKKESARLMTLFNK